LLAFTTARLYYFTTLLQAEHERAASLLREQLAASKDAERHAVAHAAAAQVRRRFTSFTSFFTTSVARFLLRADRAVAHAAAAQVCHAYIYIYIYVYILVCVRVCVCV